MPGIRKTDGQKLLEEIEESQREKRERNKYAAARCRQKVLDRTDALTKEVESEEQNKARLEAEIKLLLRTYEDLNTLLSEHKQVCKDPKLREDSRNSPETRKRPRSNSSTDENPTKRLCLMLDEKVNSSAMPSRPLRPTSLAIGNVGSSEESNSNSNNFQKEDQNRPSRWDLGSKRKIEAENQTDESSAFIPKNFCQYLNFSKLEQDPSNSSFSETRKRPRSNSPTDDDARIRKKQRNSDSSRSSGCDVSNSLSSVFYGGSNSSPCSELSNISNDYSNSPSQDVVLDKKLDLSAKSSRPRPTFLNIRSASSNKDSNGSNGNCQEQDQNRPKWLDLGSERKDKILDFDSEFNCESMLKGGTGLTPVDDPNKSFLSTLMLHENFDSPAMPSRPTCLAIGDASSSNDSNSSNNYCQEQDQNRPTWLNLGSERKDKILDFDSEINCESMLKGGTGLTPVDDPNKSFLSTLMLHENFE